MPVERPLITLLRSHGRGATLRLLYGAVVRPCSDLVGEVRPVFHDLIKFTFLSKNEVASIGS